MLTVLHIQSLIELTDYAQGICQLLMSRYRLGGLSQALRVHFEALVGSIFNSAASLLSLSSSFFFCFFFYHPPIPPPQLFSDKSPDSFFSSSSSPRQKGKNGARGQTQVFSCGFESPDLVFPCCSGTPSAPQPPTQTPVIMSQSSVDCLPGPQMAARCSPWEAVGLAGLRLGLVMAVKFVFNQSQTSQCPKG